MASCGKPIERDDLASAERLSALTGTKITEVVQEGMAGAGGLSGDMLRLRVTMETTDAETGEVSSTQKTFVSKTSKPDATSARQLGLAREAFFYVNLADRIRKDVGNVVAEVLAAYGDMSTGHKAMIMEDLTGAIQTGYFFGPGSPHNWGKDLEKLTAPAKDMTAEKMTSLAFQAAAKFHALYWKDSKMLEHAWLRGSDWIQGKGEEAFNMAQKHAGSLWEKTKGKIADGTDTVKWDANLVACLDASFAKVSFADFQTRVQSTPWTLVHGDFHPANMMFDPVANRLILLDWEVIGFGNGPQDLAQYVISHMAPSVRKACEEGLVRDYYATLTAGGVTGYTWEECWSDYKRGGSERWMWLMGLLSQLCPPVMNQFFQDQVAAFLHDHNITPENIGMPRV